MNGTPPPPMPTAPAKKPGMPTWAIVLLVVGGAGVVVMAVIGMLAAIAIPNFVKARETAQINACINYMMQIDGAKQQWALENKKAATDTPTESQVVFYLKNRQLPICPAGGTYTINAVGENPACTVPNHRLSASPTFQNR